jgi:broad specificity phosphatase PhoE
MAALIIILSLVGLASVIFFFTGWLDIAIDTLISLAYSRHQKICRSKRPPRIFLIRHGQSQANIDHSKPFLFQYNLFYIFIYFSTALITRMPDNEIELTELGHQQATAAGEKLHSLIGNETMYVYMSPYLRSRQTWEGIKKAFSPSQTLTERQDPRLREIELGTGDDLQQLIKRIDELRRNQYFYRRLLGGESGADVYDRVSLFLDTIFREMDDGHHDRTQNIVIVSHGFFLLLFLMRYFRWNVEDLIHVKRIENCIPLQLTKVDGVYTLDGTTKPPTKSS